ncbi:MAG TPA: hypothetical protein VFG58_07560 [Solirubrobacterales bacterium]|nr:hypothetical protein [Solirubrobacterales bacterium]
MSELISAAVALTGVFAGAAVSFGVPALARREDHRRAENEEERSIADRILAMWEQERDLFAVLTARSSPQRRNLMLLGVRLRNQEARRACLDLVQLADGGTPDETALLNAWADMVAAVAATYRGLPAESAATRTTHGR